MALKDCEMDVAELLEEAGVGSTSTTPPTLYAGPFPSTGPDALVNVQDVGAGEGAEQLLGGGGRVALAPEVTVRVRGVRHQYAEARTAAFAAWQALWEARPEGYVRMVPLGSGPGYVGPDEVGRHRFSFTVRCEYRATGAAGTVTPDG
jgi:hypothetical protein